MNSIRLEINIGTTALSDWRDIYLDDDQSIDMEENSPLWNEASTYSLSFDIPVEPNIRCFGNIDHLNGANIYDALYKHQYRLWVSGMIFRQGTIDMDDEVEIDEGSVEVSLTSGRKSLEDILDGVNCQDIDLESENIIIGYINNVKNAAVNDAIDMANYAGANATLAISRSTDIHYPAQQYPATTVFQLGVFNQVQQLIVSPDKSMYRDYLNSKSIFGGDATKIQAFLDSFTDYTNCSFGYDEGAKFCHVPICYQRRELSGTEWVDKKGYQDTTMECGDPGAPSRPGSAPCFYVLYIIDLLFKQLGIRITSNALKSFKDINRMAFLHTDWHAKVGDWFSYSEYIGVDPLDIGKTNMIPMLYPRADCKFNGNMNEFGTNGVFKIASSTDVYYCYYNEGGTRKYGKMTLAGVGNDITYAELNWVSSSWTAGGVAINDRYLHYAYATSENLPDLDASSLIEGLEHMFGCRFLYDEIHNSIRIILIKDVLSSQDVLDMNVPDYAVHRKQNNIKGFRLKYSGTTETELNELQKANNNGEDIVIGSEDTTYNYNDWDKVKYISTGTTSASGSGTSASPIVSDAITDYPSLINNITCFDETCYVDARTGNAYRIKVNSEANSVYSDENDSNSQGLDPALFEVATLNCVEVGDCSDDDFIEEVTIDLGVIIPNDINFSKEKAYYSGNSSSETAVVPQYSWFVDVELNTGYDASVTYDLAVGNLKAYDPAGDYTNSVKFSVTETYPNMPAGWDVSTSLESPLQTLNQNPIIGILRPLKTESGINEYDYDYDGQGNSKFSVQQASSAQVTSDSVDAYGNKFVGADISLKLKAEKFNTLSKASATNPVQGFTYNPYKDITDEDGYFKMIDSTLAKRGLYDKFYTEYAYWMVHRQIAVFTIPRGCISLATIANIDFTRKVRIGRLIGYINKISYTIDRHGIGDVELELYYL